VKIELDPVKSEWNTKLRSLPFDRAVDFNWADAVIIPDTRKSYQENRFIAVGIYIAVFTSCVSRPSRMELELSAFVKQTEERLSNMKNHLPLTNKEGEVRELTPEDFKRARPARKVLPEILGAELAAELLKRKPGKRGAQKKPKKEPVTVRYSLDVLNYFRSTGPGWQTRIDAALKDWVAQHRQGSER